ncbi:MAG: lmo0937 family membrane protein [Patescibacteria group bacterium]|nr:lmo0937 family membrane protein [Patescibacteria group bacterium]
MLLKIAAILVVLWLLGLIAHVGGAIIHVVLVIALIVFIFHFLTGRKSV